MPVGLAYIYYTSTDTVAVMRSKGPNASSAAAPITSAKTPSFDQQPATILGGALKNVRPGNAVTAPAANVPPKPTVNILA